MVANVTHSRMSHVCICHMFKWLKIFFLSIEGPHSSYLVLKFGNILPIKNWNMAQNVISKRSWLWKVKVIGQNKWHHRIPWSQKHRSRRQIVILSALVEKLWWKTSLCIMVANKMRSCTSHVQTAQDINKNVSFCSKALTQATLC